MIKQGKFSLIYESSDMLENNSLHIDELMVGEVTTLTILRNTIMKKGKKGVADKVVNNILILLRSSGVSRPITRVYRSINVLRPMIETRPVKRGGRVVQVPSLIKKPRQNMLAIHWLVDAAKHRARKRDTGRYGLAYGLAQEVRAIYLDSMLPMKTMVYSEAIAKRNMLHKQANSQRVNQHISKKR